MKNKHKSLFPQRAKVRNDLSIPRVKSLLPGITEKRIEAVRFTKK
jgi:hypothetical protein